MLGTVLVAAALLAPSPQAQTLQLLNAARATQGAPALRPDPRLARAARAHSRDMVARHYFDHVSPRGAGLRERVARTGWTRGRNGWRLAENLGWGSGSLATPSAIVAAWLDSRTTAGSCSTGGCGWTASGSRPGRRRGRRERRTPRTSDPPGTAGSPRHSHASGFPQAGRSVGGSSPTS